MAKYTDENGNVVELPDGTDITKLQADAARAAELAAKESQWEKDRKDLEEAANPNFKRMRESQSRMRQALEAKGFKTDEDGNILDSAPIKQEDIRSVASEEARKIQMETVIEGHLQGIDTNIAAAIRDRFNRLSSGEKLTVETVNKFMQEARAAVGYQQSANPLHRASSSPLGAPPRLPDPAQEVDKKRGMEIAESFGYQFKNKDKINK